MDMPDNSEHITRKGLSAGLIRECPDLPSCFEYAYQFPIKCHSLQPRCS